MMGVKNSPPEKPLGKGRLMEDLSLRLIFINQFLVTLGSWRGLLVFFCSRSSLIFSSSYFSSTPLHLDCLGEVRQSPSGKSESLDGPAKCMSFPSRRQQWDQIGRFSLLAQFPKYPGFSEKGCTDEQDKRTDVLRNSSKVHSAVHAASLGEARAIFLILERICRPWSSYLLWCIAHFRSHFGTCCCGRLRHTRQSLELAKK